MEEKKCPYCDKIIKGYSEKHIEYLLGQHILSKHKDKNNKPYYGEPDGERYYKIKENDRGYEFIEMDKVSQLINILIKKGVITVKDLNGYKKLKDLKNQVKELDKKLRRKYPIKLQEAKKNGKKQRKNWRKRRES